MIRGRKKKREVMSILQEATVKLILEALQSTHLTIVGTFVMMAISTESPFSRSFLNEGIETLLDSLLRNEMINVTVSNWVTFQAKERNDRPYFQGKRIPFLDCKNDPKTTAEF